MDEKILKWTAGSFVILAVVVCVSLFRFPEMESFLSARREARRQEEMERARKEAEKEAVMTAQIEALMEHRAEDTEAGEPVVTEAFEKYAGVISSDGSTDKNHDINLQIPEGVSARDVEVSGDYMSRTVKVSFPSNMRDYFAHCRVWGDSREIASMNYYLKGSRGVLEFKTDGIYELSWKIEGRQAGLDLTDPRKKYEKIVVIDAGHGGIKSGAEREGVEEKDINLAIVKALKDYAQKKGNGKIGFFYTRLEDRDVDLEDRIGLANDLKADLFISVHNNSTASLSAAQVLSGTQVLYSESDKGKQTSEALAGICLKQMTSALDSRNLGLLPGDDIYIIRNSKVPAALIEVGFMTNQRERELLCTGDYQERAAIGIYKAIEQAFQEGF